MKAFPIKGWNGHEQTIHEGMDLRDYFAAKALPRLIDFFKDEEEEYISNPVHVAKQSYKYADAMMKAREA